MERYSTGLSTTGYNSPHPGRRPPGTVDKPAAWNTKLVPPKAVRNMEMPVSEYYNSVIRGARAELVAVCGNPSLRVSLDSRCPRERTFPSRRSPMESSHEQAHFPAEQPSPQPHARFPLPHAHPRRSRHPECPSPQGSHGAVRLIRQCCPDPVGCAAPLTSPRPSGRACGPAPRASWSTWP